MSITSLNGYTAAGGLLSQKTTAEPVTQVKPVKLPMEAQNTAYAAERTPTNAELEEAVKKLNDFISPALQTIQFAMDEESGKVIVKVIDTETNRVLRQIPNAEALSISQTLDRIQGLVIKQSA